MTANSWNSDCPETGRIPNGNNVRLLQKSIFGVLVISDKVASRAKL